VAIGFLPVIEVELSVCAITKWLVFRAAAAAKCHTGNVRKSFPPRVGYPVYALGLKSGEVIIGAIG
jgi:hypothetical protein